eukprot:CAMPEP_0176404534 /NCGR_PEP_ID=MMETSP0126-20121128/50957_1 /TAXON_ID=141414 ORGANISM="Strombidinopsis acuminatum, Strain SPMC142" /NCGR_SAMPLE_ID=MMETSP0126 /ASSEMBLY_ACC=CAM_ASM_000229 /LENGTH=77 /DNA_ID=CAMNT_0017783413 /DNA_START=178 /DNA_END=411 /DNA_ORIENTATION=-
MPALNGSKHTIIGRLLSGKDTLTIIENAEEYFNVKSTFDSSNIGGALGYGKIPDLPTKKNDENTTDKDKQSADKDGG